MKYSEKVTEIIQEERWRKLCLLALWERRAIGDETTVYKSTHGGEGLI